MGPTHMVMIGLWWEMPSHLQNAVFIICYHTCSHRRPLFLVESMTPKPLGITIMVCALTHSQACEHNGN